MDGPDIIVRTLSMPAIPDKYGNMWQYHSRSDRHSKVACWAILFDLLQNSTLLAEHIAQKKIFFSINRQMRDTRTNRTKDLDLVIGRPGPKPLVRNPHTMKDLALRWGIRLSSDQQNTLANLPLLLEGVVGEVVLAMEVKACMTAHIKALPRLFDELTSSYTTIHGDTQNALAVGFAMINASSSFISSDMNKFDINEHWPNINDHPQHAAERAIAKVREIDRRNGQSSDGFDAFGAMLISMRNDSSPVKLVTDPPAPKSEDPDFYQRMIKRIVQRYETDFCDL